MVVSLEEMKNYLRVDTSEDDNLISTLIQSAEKMCLDIVRKNEEEIIGENFEEEIKEAISNGQATRNYRENWISECLSPFCRR